ncbi:MAG: flavodoxin family protein [Clostridia bacterium]|nr:flavodoxin family protein [Clostridia bacterium]
MKIAVVWSSPNREGLTASAKDSFISGLQKAGAQVEQIHMNVLSLEHCRACGDGWGPCRSEGRCVIKDDFENVCQLLHLIEDGACNYPVVRDDESHLPHFVI